MLGLQLLFSCPPADAAPAFSIPFIKHACLTVTLPMKFIILHNRNRSHLPSNLWLRLSLPCPCFLLSWQLLPFGNIGHGTALQTWLHAPWAVWLHFAAL